MRKLFGEPVQVILNKLLSQDQSVCPYLLISEGFYDFHPSVSKCHHEVKVEGTYKHQD